jgi:hypothetical protein
MYQASREAIMPLYVLIGTVLLNLFAWLALGHVLIHRRWIRIRQEKGCLEFFTRTGHQPDCWIGRDEVERIVVTKAWFKASEGARVANYAVRLQTDSGDEIMLCASTDPSIIRLVLEELASLTGKDRVFQGVRLEN